MASSMINLSDRIGEDIGWEKVEGMHNITYLEPGIGMMSGTVTYRNHLSSGNKEGLFPYHNSC